MVSRKRVAQVCAAGAAAATFLPWHARATESETGTVIESLAGTTLGEGRLVFIVCLVAVGLIQLGWRPAWIVVGLAVAAMLRGLFQGDSSPRIGLWVALIASVVAVVVLIWDMFANVGSARDDDTGPPKRGLSGPLGRRPR